MEIPVFAENIHDVMYTRQLGTPDPILKVQLHVLHTFEMPALLLAGLLLLAGCEHPSEPSGEDLEPPVPVLPMDVAAYHPSWLGRAWETYDYDVIDDLYFFDLPIQPDGSLSGEAGWPYGWVEMLGTAASAGVPVHLTITLFDTHIFTQVFSDSVRTTTLIEELALLSESGSVGGIHLDIELFDPLETGLRDSLSLFVERAASEVGVGRSGFELSMFLLALDAHDNYDEARIAQAVDHVVVQGYDLHWMGDVQAGPVANVRGWGRQNWHGILARMDALGVERQKMLFSVPYYGYEWPTTGPDPGAPTRGAGQLITYAPVLEGLPSARERSQEYGLRRDAQSGTPYYAYEDSTGWHQGWFDDAFSLFEKARFVRDQGLGGIAVFPYGYGDASLETTLRLVRSGVDSADELAAQLALIGQPDPSASKISAPIENRQSFLRRHYRRNR